jgi:type IV secretion system protein VirD4
MRPNRVGEVMALIHPYTPFLKAYGLWLLWGVCGLMFLVLLWSRRQGRLSRRTSRDARWASWRDLRQAYMLGTVGIVVGSVGNAVLRYWGRGHVFVVAATQTGKTLAVVLPTLLEPQPKRKPYVSVIINDPKGELYPVTAPYRATISRVIHLAPMQPGTDHYNPLDALGIGTEQETARVQLFSRLLVNPEGTPITSEASQHFVDLTEIVVRGLTIFGVKTGRATSLGEFYILVTQGELPTLFQAMRAFPHPMVRQAAELLASMDEKQYDGVVTTLMRVYQLYGDPLIGEMVSYSDFTLEDLRQGETPLSVYLSIPFVHLERLRPFTCLCFNQWLGHATDVPHDWRRRGWHKVLAMGEEFPSLKHLTIARDIMNQGAGLGVQLCLVTPSLNDIEAIWGRHHNFLDNAHVQLFFGITDGQVAQRISTRLGTQTVLKERITKDRGRRTVSQEYVREPLMDVSAITHMDTDHILVLARNQQVLAQQTPWDQWEPWKSRGVKA